MNPTVGEKAINLVQKARPEVLATDGGERGSRSPLSVESPSPAERGVRCSSEHALCHGQLLGPQRKKKAFHKPCSLGKKERKCEGRDTENRGQGRDTPVACSKRPCTDRKCEVMEGTWAPPLSLGSGPGVLSSHGGQSLQVTAGTQQGNGAKRWAQCLAQAGWAPRPRPSTRGARLPGPLGWHRPPLLHGQSCSLAVLRGLALRRRSIRRHMTPSPRTYAQTDARGTLCLSAPST